MTKRPIQNILIEELQDKDQLQRDAEFIDKLNLLLKSHDAMISAGCNCGTRAGVYLRACIGGYAYTLKKGPYDIDYDGHEDK